MAEPAGKRWTLEEFLTWDDGTDRRYELVEGHVVAMAPPSEAHGTIVANLTANCEIAKLRVASSAKRGSCRPIGTTPPIKPTCS